MRAIIDADILRYEVGYAAETGWRAIKDDPEALPPFDYVRDMLNQRIGYIKGATRSQFSTLYMTEGPTFREKIAVTKPYKGTRKDTKPWHYDNLTVYLRDVLGARVVTEIEADDAMAIDHVQSADETILCSRDKDLRQVPGEFFSWELGKQPEFQTVVDPLGYVHLDREKSTPKLTGTGYLFFASQVLTGDTVDNIPGLPKTGPVAAYDELVGRTPEEAEQVLFREYKRVYGDDWEIHLTEQAQLCWIVRRLEPESMGVPGGTPELWRKGLYV